MNNMMKHKVNADQAGLRLDHFLLTIVDESRASIQKKIKAGFILVNQMSVKTGYILSLDDEITIETPADQPLDLEPVDLELDIVYQDPDLVVINKPKGLVVHPAKTYDKPTLVHGLLAQIQDLSAINGVIRPGIVHRIDKDTTGLLLVAKNDQAHHFLAQQLTEHLIKRKYYALVYGHVKNVKGIIDAPIGRHPVNRLKYAVVKEGKPSVTHFKVIKNYLNFTLLELELETGRTHQIRVHLNYIGYPIVGDPIYGPSKVIGKEGQFLHAYSLSFVQPTTKKEVTITCDLPKYFADFIQILD